MKIEKKKIEEIEHIGNTGKKLSNLEKSEETWKKLKQIQKFNTNTNSKI